LIVIIVLLLLALFVLVYFSGYVR